MTGPGGNEAMQRLDQSLAGAEAACAMALPAVPPMRLAAARIAEGRAMMDAAFAARLDYRQVRAAARRVTLDAAARARKAEAGHRRLRRRLFWQLAWARYQDVVWALLGLAVVAALVWAGWLWRAEIMALIVPPALAPALPPPALAPGGVP